MFRQDPLFDICLPEYQQVPMEPGAVVVPQTMIRAKFDSRLAPLRGAIDTLVAAGAAQIAIVGTPPPKDDDAIMRMLDTEPFFVQTIANLGLDRSTIHLTPRFIRLKLWAVLQASYRELAEDRGLAFIGVPDTARAADGLLSPEYGADDVTHANDDYGRLMLDVIAGSI